MYFEKAGPKNTDRAIVAAVAAAKDRGIKHIVAASTTGASAGKLVRAVQGGDLKVVVVTHNTGFSEPGGNEFEPAAREEVYAAGHVVLTATMVTRNINKAISSRMGGFSHTEIINAALRMFGQGMKVLPEITAMAADAGLIPFEDVVAIAGTGRGYDTAAVLKADSSNRFFDIKIREIICKPRNF